MRLIYSQGEHPLMEGRTFINARFFDGVVDGASSVVVIGEFPEIVEAYREAGVEVEEHGSEAARAETLTEAPATWTEPVRRRRKAADEPAPAEAPAEAE